GGRRPCLSLRRRASERAKPRDPPCARTGATPRTARRERSPKTRRTRDVKLVRRDRALGRPDASRRPLRGSTPRLSAEVWSRRVQSTGWVPPRPRSSEKNRHPRGGRDGGRGESVETRSSGSSKPLPGDRARDLIDDGPLGLRQGLIVDVAMENEAEATRAERDAEDAPSGEPCR